MAFVYRAAGNCCSFWSPTREDIVATEDSARGDGEFFQRDRTLHPPALTPELQDQRRSARRAMRCCRCRTRSPRSPARLSATTTSARSTTT